MFLWVLSAVIVLEAVVALLLISRVRILMNIGCFAVDVSKTAKGSAVTKTLAATLLVFLASSISTFIDIRQHIVREHALKGHDSSVDFLILRSAEHEISFSCFILLLALMINRVHFYQGRIDGLKLDIQVLQKQSKGAQTEYLRLQQQQQSPSVEKSKSESESAANISSLKDVIAELRKKLEQLQIDSQIKEKEAKAAEANAEALHKQAEGYRLGYDRLLDDNENLRNQLSTFDKQYSKSNSKKNS